MREEDVYEALQVYLSAASNAAAAGATEEQRRAARAAQLEYENRLEAYLMRLRVPGRQTREAIAQRSGARPSK